MNLRPSQSFSLVYAILSVIGIFIVAALAGCGSKDQSEPEPRQNFAFDNSAPLNAEKSENELRILFLGNSHSAPIPELLTQIYSVNQTSIKATFRKPVSIGFLEEQSKSTDILDLLQNGSWDYVILQAQKYSQSGKYKYPTTGAEKLATLAKKSGAKVIMFPEWSQRDAPNEYQRIRKIHETIASKTDAVVAPIGEAWQLINANYPDINLYAADGNHASLEGSYLVAAVFYSLIQKEQLKRTGVSAVKDSAELEKAAWQAVSDMKNRAQKSRTENSHIKNRRAGNSHPETSQ